MHVFLPQLLSLPLDTLLIPDLLLQRAVRALEKHLQWKMESKRCGEDGENIIR